MVMLNGGANEIPKMGFKDQNKHYLRASGATGTCCDHLQQVPNQPSPIHLLDEGVPGQSIQGV